MDNGGILINRAGWVRAARDLGMGSIPEMAGHMGMEPEVAAALWSGKASPTTKDIARSLRHIPASFHELYVLA